MHAQATVVTIVGHMEASSHQCPRYLFKQSQRFSLVPVLASEQPMTQPILGRCIACISSLLKRPRGEELAGAGPLVAAAGGGQAAHLKVLVGGILVNRQTACAIHVHDTQVVLSLWQPLLCGLLEELCCLDLSGSTSCGLLGLCCNALWVACLPDHEACHPCPNSTAARATFGRLHRPWRLHSLGTQSLHHPRPSGPESRPPQAALGHQATQCRLPEQGLLGTCESVYSI